MTGARDLRHAGAFYALALVLALAVALGADTLGEATPLVTMFTPLAAVLVLRLAVLRDGWRRAAWGELGLFRAGLRYWPAAMVLPFVVLLPGYALVWAVSGAPADLAGGRPALQAAVQLVLSLAIGTTLGALGEEVGWRGYLQPRLRSLGPWLSLFLTGLLHGLWHLPLILLTPFYHAAGAPWAVVPLFLATLTLTGPIYGYLRIASASIWPVALMHRSVNVFWERLNAATLTDAPWLEEYVAGESGIAVIAMLAVLVVALKLLWRPPDL
jgi:membrane protease YdiL (CAAX protease family)